MPDSRGHGDIDRRENVLLRHQDRAAAEKQHHPGQHVESMRKSQGEADNTHRRRSPKGSEVAERARATGSKSGYDVASAVTREGREGRPSRTAASTASRTTHSS